MTLYEQLADMGLSVAEFIRRTGLSPQTVKRVNEGQIERLRPLTRARFRKAMEALRTNNNVKAS